MDKKMAQKFKNDRDILVVSTYYIENIKSPLDGAKPISSEEKRRKKK